MNDTLNKSKKLSFLLRHCKEPLYINLNGGWANVDTVLEVLSIERDFLEQIVLGDSKGRFSFNEVGDKIRANQGHSIKGVVIENSETEPPEILFHGTATRFLENIMREGLKPMGRNYVHLSKDVETAIKVGSRHGEPIVLVVNAKKFIADGNKLYLSPNGIWQVKLVPVQYLEIKFS